MHVFSWETLYEKIPYIALEKKIWFPCRALENLGYFSHLKTRGSTRACSKDQAAHSHQQSATMTPGHQVQLVI